MVIILGFKPGGRRVRDVYCEEKNPFHVQTAHKRAFSLRDNFVRPKKASNNNVTLLKPPSLDSKRFHALSEAVRVNYLQQDNDYY